MRRKRAIREAISEVLRDASKPMSPEKIYQAIIERRLYSFPAQDPVHVVRTTLRRHSVNLDFPTARPSKYFSFNRGEYSLLPKPVTLEATAFKIKGRLRGGKERIVSVPSNKSSTPVEKDHSDDTHTRIQWTLLDLGARMGLSVWAPMSDRGRTYKGQQIGAVQRMLHNLPQQFEPAAKRIVSNIDVIWLEGRTLCAAFEVEHSTPIYSGLLRIADLLTLVPNQDLKWYIVSSENRFDRFAAQVTRPVFQHALRKPLHSVCRFISYSRLIECLNEARNVIEDLKPSFLDRIAEAYDPAEAFDG